TLLGEARARGRGTGPGPDPGTGAPPVRAATKWYGGGARPRALPGPDAASRSARRRAQRGREIDEHPGADVDLTHVDPCVPGMGLLDVAGPHAYGGDARFIQEGGLDPGAHAPHRPGVSPALERIEEPAHEPGVGGDLGA